MATTDALKKEEGAKLDNGREIIIKVLQNKKRRKSPESGVSKERSRKLSNSAIVRRKSD